MIQIIADTLSCLGIPDAEALNIPLLPQIIIFGEESFRDDTEIDSQTFLRKLKSSRELPKTAAPSPLLYQPIFREILDRGDTPFVICPTAELSGTYRSAMVAAKEFPEFDIRIVDTRTLAAGLGTIVRQAVKWATEGIPVDELEDKVIEMAAREKVFFLVATLEYLHKGGRIGGAQALLGSVLQVKPILQVKNGQIGPAGSQRTRKKAIAYIQELVSESCPHDPNAFLSVMHGGVHDDALEMAAELQRITGIQDIPIYDLPAAILVHGGPGAFGISFFTES